MRHVRLGQSCALRSSKLAHNRSPRLNSFATEGATSRPAAIVARQELERLVPLAGALELQNRIDELRQWQLSLPSQLKSVKLPEQDYAEKALQGAQTELQKARERVRVDRAVVEERASSVALGLTPKC